MRISALIPNELGDELERFKREAKTSTSDVVQAALGQYLGGPRRRAARAVKEAAQAAALSQAQAREALLEIERERGRCRLATPWPPSITCPTA